MTWFAFKGLNNDKAIDLAGSQEKEAVSVGFHGYGTEQQAEAQPNSTNLLTRYIADALIADYNMAVKQGSQPGGPNANILNPATAIKAGIQGDINSIPGFGALGDIGDFFHRLTEKETWTRVAEFAIGALLLYAGIKAATSGTTQTAAKNTVKRSGGIAKRASKATPIGRAYAVRKAGKQRAQRIVYRRDVRERTGTELMRLKKRRGRAP